MSDEREFIVYPLIKKMEMTSFLDSPEEMLDDFTT